MMESNIRLRVMTKILIEEEQNGIETGRSATKGTVLKIKSVA